MGTQNFYCEYCGKRYPSVQQLTNGLCPRHPDGSNRGSTNFTKEEKRKNTPASIAERSILPSLRW